MVKNVQKWSMGSIDLRLTENFLSFVRQNQNIVHIVQQ